MQAPYTAPMPRDPALLLRASDAERERTASLLARHSGEGRLDPEELEARIQSAYAARTLGELEGLTGDLPVLDPPAVPAPELGPDERKAQRRLQRVLGAYAVLVVFWVAIWAASGGGYFWPIWPALGVGVPTGIAAVTLWTSIDRQPRRRSLPE